LKIALDENIPHLMVIVFQTLAKEGSVLNGQIVSARDYRPFSEQGDEHWIRRFAADGGQVVISGDTRMRSRIHELAALVECGLITYFFERRWSAVNFYTKSAMLLHWWQAIRAHMDMAAKGTCWEIPHQWQWKDLVDVSIDPKKITPKRRKPT
jgi:PIN like domain